MKRLRRAFVLAPSLLLLSASTIVSAQAVPETWELVVCGWDEVFILEFSAGRDSRKVWSWRADQPSGLPEAFGELFKTTDECKPVDNGRKVLITSSGGAVALVDRQQNRVLFYGRAANAHSADLLPGGRIAVAASVDPQGRGDRLVIFDRSGSDQPLWTEALPSGHGVVWDEERKLLWALADADLRVFSLRDWDTAIPKLRRVAVIALPENGGHDLQPVTGSPLLSVTTTNHSWLFDRDARTFVLHPKLGDRRHVKSISKHPVTGQTVYVQADEPNWWTQCLRFLYPDQTLCTPGEHYYKARWNIPAARPVDEVGDGLLLFQAKEAEQLRDRIQDHDPALQVLVGTIRKQAETARKEGPWSVTFRRPPGLQLSPNDFYSEGPYWWPDPQNPTGPHIRRDGERNPDRFTANDDDLASMSRAVFRLGLAAYLLDDRESARRASEVLRVWFITRATRMNTNLEYGQAIKGVTTGRGIGIIDTVPLIWAVQGLHFLEASGQWPPSDAAAVRDWFREYLRWLTTSGKGIDEKMNGNNHSTWWSAQVAAYSLFVGDVPTFETTCRFFEDYLVPHQIRPDGSCPLEEARTRSLSYSAMNLNGFALLCRMAEIRGRDLWHFSAPTGAGVLDAVRYLYPYIKAPGTWRKQQITKFDPGSVYFYALAGLATGNSEYLRGFESLTGTPDDPALLTLRLLLTCGASRP